MPHRTALQADRPRHEHPGRPGSLRRYNRLWLSDLVRIPPTWLNRCCRRPDIAPAQRRAAGALFIHAEHLLPPSPVRRQANGGQMSPRRMCPDGVQLVLGCQCPSADPIFGARDSVQSVRDRGAAVAWCRFQAECSRWWITLRLPTLRKPSSGRPRPARSPGASPSTSRPGPTLGVPIPSGGRVVEPLNLAARLARDPRRCDAGGRRAFRRLRRSEHQVRC
jgi:hypothetical protein